jgi:hypothetical protein
MGLWCLKCREFLPFEPKTSQGSFFLVWIAYQLNYGRSKETLQRYIDHKPMLSAASRQPALEAHYQTPMSTTNWSIAARV